MLSSSLDTPDYGPVVDAPAPIRQITENGFYSIPRRLCSKKGRLGKAVLGRKSYLEIIIVGEKGAPRYAFGRGRIVPGVSWRVLK